MINRWIICLTGTAINICLGVLYSWSIFVVPLSEKFGWTRAQLSWPFTLSIFTFALVMVAAGKWQDKVGPRIVCVTGGLVMGVGFILTSFISSLGALYLTYGVIGGAGVAMGYVTPVATTIKWFPDKKGLTVGITVSGFGFGAFVFTPIAVKLIKAVGIMNAFFWLGVIWIVAVCGLGMVLHNPPPGWKPEGWEPPAPTAAAPAGADWHWQDMIKTSTFWLLWLAFLGNASVGIMVISLIAPYAKTLGISAETAAFLVGFLSIANGFGRIIAGWLSDLLGRTRAMVLIFSITTINVFLLPYAAKTTAGYAIALLICGASYGANFALFPAATAAFFGSKFIGTNYAAVFTAWGVAGVVGPQAKAAMLRKYTTGLTGEELRLARLKAYKLSFYIGTACGLLAVITSILCKPPGAPPEPAK
jgi:OFA family oxalate/formate antiporter-like MFS transporter